MTDKKEEILWKYKPATIYSSAITFTQEDCYKAMTEYADSQAKERAVADVNEFEIWKQKNNWMPCAYDGNGTVDFKKIGKPIYKNVKQLYEIFTKQK